MTVYQLRINDFLNEITRQGIEWFERNENAQEYFGTQLTTKHLYDTVAGIGKVQIHLFKIEEQREYPSHGPMWPETREGRAFCPAFIILSSLLCYMRGMIQISSQTEMKERFSSWITICPDQRGPSFKAADWIWQRSPTRSLSACQALAESPFITGCQYLRPESGCRRSQKFRPVCADGTISKEPRRRQ